MPRTPMTASPRYVLAIDLGTSGPKAALVSEHGDVFARAIRTIVTRLIPPNGAEQDPDDVWGAVVSAIREINGAAGVSPASIVAVAVASQYFSIVPVGADGEAVGPLLLWQDGRGGPHSIALHSKHPTAFPRWMEIHGIPPLPSGADSLSKMLWVKAERPDVYERTRCFLEPVDFILARLSKRFTANICTAFSMLLTSQQDLASLSWDEELVEMSGIDPERLPALVSPNSVIGKIDAVVAEDLGLSPKTVIISGVNDTQAAAVATGAFRPSAGALNAGTTGQVLAGIEMKKGDLAKSLVSMPSAVAGRYMVMAENGIAARSLDHFLRSIVFANDPLADHLQDDPFASVDAAVESTPPGAGGLLFLPSLTGTVSPNANDHARGAFINIGLETDRARMVRAVFEGVAFSLRGLLTAVEEFTGDSYSELRFSGGGARSDAWARIFADVIGRPIHPLADPVHASNRASALLAFQALGIASLDDIDRFCPIRGTFEPRTEYRAPYDHLFGQFQAAYAALQPVFHSLNGPGAPPTNLEGINPVTRA
ncbi:MAG TPA: FGGY-family carbohydrate kinase [Dehalococcoidia bacterium]|nr:FGGY-family carbohydrate kinase [Dehalococcoidia bacterium]